MSIEFVFLLNSEARYGFNISIMKCKFSLVIPLIEPVTPF